MVARNPTSFRVVQDRRRAGLVYDVVLRILQIRPLLFPEEEYAEVAHEGGELICDVLQRLRLLLQGTHKT